jgi:hypothetical protein
MSLEEIKSGIAGLNASQLNEVTAFLFHVRHANDDVYAGEINRRIEDRDSTHWLTPEEFEKRLDCV